MRLALRVTPNAEQQIREAADWWWRNRRGAYALFGEQLQRGFELATTQPNAGIRARDVALAGVRRLLLSRIRYHLYYTMQAEVVEVLALWHASRGTLPHSEEAVAGCDNVSTAMPAAALV